MANRHQRPLREHEVRIGHTYYMPVPSRNTCRRGADCTCRQVGLKPGQGCSPIEGGCLLIYVNCPQQAQMVKWLLRDGTLLYRSKGKAKRQGLRGNWLRKWQDRSIFKAGKEE